MKRRDLLIVVTTAVLFLIALGSLTAVWLSEQGVDVGIGMSPERRAVHRWLDENANDPDWEEVRWWGPVPIDKAVSKGRGSMYSGYDLTEREASQKMRSLALKKMRERGIQAMARIKWRGATPSGGPKLHDDRFFIYEDGHIERLPATEPHYFDHLVEFRWDHPEP